MLRRSLRRPRACLTAARHCPKPPRKALLPRREKLLFNSLDFLIFFVVFFAVFALCPGKIRGLLILAASLIFYGLYDWRIMLLLVATTWVTFRLSLRQAAAKTERSRKSAAAASVLVSIAFLVFFKYFLFFGGGLNQ